MMQASTPVGFLKMAISFRHSASFGRRMEYWIIGRMLKEGLDVYVPLVDDSGIDAVIRKGNRDFIEVQIKARSDKVAPGNAALFAAIEHERVRDNYYFVFYSERLGATWIMSSEEFIADAVQNKTGKNAGKRSIWFNGCRAGTEYAHAKFDKYRVTDFSRFQAAAELVFVPGREA